MEEITETEARACGEYLHKELTENVIQIFYNVYNELGYGFVESVYQNAMYYALKDAGYRCEPQKSINVYFRGRIVGQFRADIIVEDKIILELKAVSALNDAHVKQLSNYLRSTEMELGLLLNFGDRPQVKRWIYKQEKKKAYKKIQ